MKCFYNNFIIHYLYILYMKLVFLTQTVAFNFRLVLTVVLTTLNNTRQYF